MPYKNRSSITVRTKTKQVLDNCRTYDETWDGLLRYLYLFWKKHNKNNKKISYGAAED